MAVSKHHVCPVYMSRVIKAGYGLNPDERAPMCYFLLYRDVNYLLNSEHSSICGSAFKSHAYKMAKKGGSKKLKSRTG